MFNTLDSVTDTQDEVDQKQEMERVKTKHLSEKYEEYLQWVDSRTTRDLITHLNQSLIDTDSLVSVFASSGELRKMQAAAIKKSALAEVLLYIKTPPLERDKQQGTLTTKQQ